MAVKNSQKNIVVLICAVLVAVPMMFTAVNYNGLSFLAYLIFFTLIPGYAVTTLFKPVGISSSVRFLLAFLCGVSVLFLEYFFLYFIGQMQLITYINPIISVLFLLLRRKSLKPSIQALGSFLQGNVAFAVFFTFSVYITLFNLNFTMPSAMDIFYADYTWQIGNINQLASSVPFDDIRVTGVQFTYHFFNTLYLAIAKIVGGMPGWVYLIQYQVFYIPLLLCVSIYTLIKRAIKSEALLLIISVATYLGFSFSHQYSSFIFQASTNANAAGFACVIVIALFFMVCTLFESKHKTKKNAFVNILYSVCLIVLLTGTKGPYTIVFLTALVCYIATKFICNKRCGKDVLIFFAMAAVVFAGMYSFLFVNGTQSYFTGSFFDTFLKSAVRTPSFFGAYSYLGEDLFARVVLLIPSLIFTFTFAVIPLLCAVIKLLKLIFKKHHMKDEKVLAVWIFLVGTAAYYTFFIEGISHVYFLFAALPFVGYIAADEINLFFQKHDKYKKGISLVLVVLICVMFNNSIITQLSDFSLSAMVNFYSQNESRYSAQKMEQHAAYEFLNEYIEDDRLILTNKLSPDNITDEVFHEISAFAEKKCYFEGYLYAERNLGFEDTTARITELTSMFSDDWTPREKYDFQVMKNIGYIVVFLHQSDIDSITLPEGEEYYRVIFENSSVVIYEVL